MRRVQQKIATGMEVIQFFTMRDWDFDSTNFKQVFDSMDADDREM